MPGIGRIIDVAEALRTPSVVIAAERCTHCHHQASTCSRCEQVCPAHAISVSADGPRIDSVMCVDCGGCVSACSTGALEGLKPRDSALAEEIATKAKYHNRVTVACSQVSSAGSGAVVLPCLARLDPSMLLFAFERGAECVSLCAGVCGSCSSRPPASRGLALRPFSAAAEAERVLRALGLPGRIEVAEGLEHAEREEAETVGLSRRGFLEALRKGSAGYAAKAVSVLLPEPGAEAAKSAEVATAAAAKARRVLPAHVPEKRERMLGVLRSLLAGRKLPREGEASPIFTAPAIERGRCNGCALCALICPTGALMTEGADGGTSGDVLRITCRSAACVECGLCVEMCQLGALCLEPVGVERVLAQEASSETLVERSEEEAKPLYISAEDKMRKLLGVAIYRT
ncbi:MAG: 4Fe-4S dicluster domain-containing protein [Coriobacteriia bacterium]